MDERPCGSVKIGLLRSSESRGVCHGTRHHACQRHEILSCHEMDDVGSHHSREYQDDGKDIEFQPPALERVEEPRPYLQADGEHKQYEPELLQEVKQGCIGTEAEMTQKNTDEQNPCGTQGHTLDLYLPEQQAYGYNQGQQHDGMSGSLSKK